MAGVEHDDPAAKLHSDLTSLTGKTIAPKAAPVVKPSAFADPIATLKVKNPAPLQQTVRQQVNPLDQGQRNVAPPIHGTPSRNSINLDQAVSHTVHGLLHPQPNYGPVVTEAQMKAGAGHGVYAMDSQGHWHTQPVSAGIVTPGAGLIAQLLGATAQKAVYAPAGVFESAVHPVRTFEQAVHNATHDPVTAAFDALMLTGFAGGAVGRGLGMTRALREGEGVGAALTRPTHEGGSALYPAPPAPRAFQLGDQQVNLLPSRNLPWRGVQELYDTAARRALAKNPGGRFAGRVTTKLGKSLDESQRIRAALQEVPAAQLQKAGRMAKLTPEHRAQNRLAVRLVAKNTTPEAQLAFHQDQMVKAAAEGKTGIVKNHEKQIGRVQAIIDRGLIGTDEAGNAIAGPAIARVEALHHEVGGKAERIITEHELMSPEALKARVDQPNVVVSGEGAAPGRTYVSDKQVVAKPSRNLFGRAQGPVVGKAQNPLAPHHPYTGGAETAGTPPSNPVRDMATHYRKLVRFANTNEFRVMRAKMGSDVKQTNRDVLVSDQIKRSKIPDESRIALGQKTRTVEEETAHAASLQDHLDALIPGRAHKFEQDKAAGIGEPAPKGYKWVDRNLLGDLAKPQGRLEDLVGEHVAGFNDAVNAGMKSAYVYAKPGHFATRYGTNATLNIFHGSGNPRNIANSVRIVHHLDQRELLQVAALGGQGYVHAIFDPAESKGIMSGAEKVAGAGAKFWGHQDTPFRVNAVVYEMRKLGFNTPAKVHDLLANPDKYRAQLDEIGKRANRENIAYDRLSTREKQVVSRTLWFYPWIKGSTQYAGRFLYEHPIKAGVVGNLGTVGYQQAQKDLGPVPSREEGLFKVGGTKQQPVTSLPNTLNLFHTPAQILEAALGMAGGKFGTPAAEVGGMATPAIATAEAEANKTDPYGAQEPHASAWKILEQQLVGGSPEALAYTRLRDLGLLKGLGINPGTPKVVNQINQAVKSNVISRADANALIKAVRSAPSKKMFPNSTSEAIGMPLAGSWWPRKTNQATLNAQAVKEMTPADKLHYELQQALDAHVLTPAEAKQLSKAAGK